MSSYSSCSYESTTNPAATVLSILTSVIWTGIFIAQVVQNQYERTTGLRLSKSFIIARLLGFGVLGSSILASGGNIPLACAGYAWCAVAVVWLVQYVYFDNTLYTTRQAMVMLVGFLVGCGAVFVGVYYLKRYSVAPDWLPFIISVIPALAFLTSFLPQYSNLCGRTKRPDGLLILFWGLDLLGSVTALGALIVLALLQSCIDAVGFITYGGMAALETVMLLGVVVARIVRKDVDLGVAIPKWNLKVDNKMVAAAQHAMRRDTFISADDDSGTDTVTDEDDDNDNEDQQLIQSRTAANQPFNTTTTELQRRPSIFAPTMSDMEVHDMDNTPATQVSSDADTQRNDNSSDSDSIRPVKPVRANVDRVRRASMMFMPDVARRYTLGDNSSGTDKRDSVFRRESVPFVADQQSNARTSVAGAEPVSPRRASLAIPMPPKRDRRRRSSVMFSESGAGGGDGKHRGTAAAAGGGGAGDRRRVSFGAGGPSADMMNRRRSTLLSAAELPLDEPKDPSAAERRRSSAAVRFTVADAPPRAFVGQQPAVPSDRRRSSLFSPSEMTKIAETAERTRASLTLANEQRRMSATFAEEASPPIHPQRRVPGSPLLTLPPSQGRRGSLSPSNAAM
eukprot:TRINITY_DN1599_c0_g1_i1.p1 TRINITY_DN1599_c0_g1~~TRINITY_DN1599_c0_g1_i1.p1  ORF type:complete len:622 (+),score=146.15 TRINITY_DN1599_c0_g1_i1:74-1939(+)